VTDLYDELLYRRRRLLDCMFSVGLTDGEKRDLASIRADLDLLDEPWLWELERVYKRHIERAAP
jgi:hypothetical protein